MYVFMLHHNKALLYLVMCGLLCWFVFRNVYIMLSDELRAVRNEASCGLMYLSMLYRFSALFSAEVFCRIYGCDKSGVFYLKTVHCVR